jgi:hypothetical protein
MFRILLLPLLLSVSVSYNGPTGSIVGALARPTPIPASDLQNRGITPAKLVGELFGRTYECDDWYVLSIQLVFSPICPLNDLLTYFFRTSSILKPNY